MVTRDDTCRPTGIRVPAIPFQGASLQAQTWHLRTHNVRGSGIATAEVVF